jgi:hypothetical protein
MGCFWTCASLGVLTSSVPLEGLCSKGRYLGVFGVLLEVDDPPLVVSIFESRPRFILDDVEFGIFDKNPRSESFDLGDRNGVEEELPQFIKQSRWKYL